MTRSVLRRLAQLPLILVVIFTITLALAWAVPGNPLENPEGPQPPAEAVEAMKARYNLGSFWAFYGTYLDRASGAGYVRARLAGERPARVFDLGPSLQYRDRTVNEILGESLPVSMGLGALAMVMALLLGVSAGVLGAIKPGGWLDHATLGVALVGVSVPSFVIGAVLLGVFTLNLGWFPIGEWGTLRAMVLPALALSLPYAAYLARLTRMGMVDALASDYARSARAKGLPERRVVLVHALRNALLPVVSYLGPALAGAMTGSFVVEVIFTVPGLGQHFVAAVQNKDLFLIMGIVLAYSTMVVLLNLGADVMYRWVDPRTA